MVLAPTRWTRLAWCSALVVGLLGSAARATGTGEEPSTADTRDEAGVVAGVVVIAIPGADAVLRERTLRPALAGHFADTHFVPELRTLAPGDILAHLEWAEGEPTGASAHAVLWVETGREGAQQLYLLQPSSGRVWVRALPMASEPEVAAESLGVMARALALGLEAGEPVGMREVVIERASEAQSVAAPPEPEPQSRPEGMIALGYHGSSVSADRRWHSGAELRLGLRLPAGFLFGAGAAWAPPARGHAVPQVDLERVAIDVRGGWQWRPHPRVHPQLDAGVVTEALRWEVRSTPQLIGRRGTAWRLGVAPGAGLTVRLWRGLGLRLHTQLDLWLRNADLVVLDGSVRSSLVRMRPVAGRGDVGLVWWL